MTVLARKFAVALLVALATLAALEAAVRTARVHAAPARAAAPDAPSMMAALAQARVSGREIGNQYLVHNIAFFAKYPQPEGVTAAFVGTSRTKVLRPRWFGIEHAVNGAGNSYNEISYGLLLQLEALRLRFPGLKTAYVEASYLLRRPLELQVAEDHRKYLPLLEAILPLQEGLVPQDRQYARQLPGLRAAATPFVKGPVLLAERGRMRFANLVGLDASLPVLDDPSMTGLRDNGERSALPSRETRPPDMRPEIKRDHVKVQRLRPVAGWAPWDSLFDMIARWGARHGIEVLFYQPPVRSDLYRFQRELGIEKHVEDLARVARQYRVPFVDMNLPELGYMQEWSLFVDEDHAGTCRGVVLMHAAIEEGRRRFHATGDLLPRLPRAELEAANGAKLQRCASSA